jgi:hypothetical protein
MHETGLRLYTSAMGEPTRSVPKEQPPPETLRLKDRRGHRLWRDLGETQGAEGITISGKRTEGA